MQRYLIGGTVVDRDDQKWAFEDVTPSDVRTAIGKLAQGEEIVFDISSPGGSCTAGIAIANMIREAAANGHPTCAHVVGLAASMASVIACACEKVTMDENAFMMIHNPWTQAEGDSERLRKEADTLDKFKCALLSVYRSKFDLADEQIARLMDNETWFTGAEAGSMSFKCDVIPCK